ncbi:LysR substrate-binding domain-containing protein [Dokdonella sp.]|uniref:LysR substrate-binding domain-containing protein n=1 Tax=Dokdonella sp. TaxID=2291710 RepID=UPI001B0AA615|nr:LysR substrate-binding domain-containing protein [Dokdonella sp.]MBO9663567.1 LysR family transcriptional regulator [Dokdonella sp.]
MLRQPPLPPLAAIRAFEAAARLGSFAKAAQELDTTAASVSYHVRRLEQHLGLPLFERHPQRVALTASGELVSREASKAFATLRASFAKATHVDETRLSLTTLPTLGTSWLTPRLGHFRARHPDIVIELDLSAEAQDLTGGHFDAAIRNGDGQWPGLHATELFPSIFMPLCAPALLAAAAALARPDLPLDVPLLGRPDWWRLWYRARGFDEAIPAERFGTTLSAEYLDITAAMAGHGIAIGSPILFRRELDAGRLVPAHDFVAGDGRAFWFACPAVRRNRRKILRFQEWLCDEAATDLRATRALVRRWPPRRDA